MRWVLAWRIAAMAFVGLSPVLFAQQRQPGQVALEQRLKSGVDLIQLDVSVLDRNRRPIRGLGIEDFAVIEDGKPQRIVAFAPVEIPLSIRKRSDSSPEIASDVLSNAMETRRLVVIVLNDGQTGFDRGESVSTRKIANAVIDELGPADLGAVVFTFMGRAQNFTNDRTKLRAAVDSFIPRASQSAGTPLGCVMKGCAVDVLRSVAALLETAPPGRKLVVFVGSSVGLQVDTASLTRGSPLFEMFSLLQRANVTVTTFDPAGLRTQAPWPMLRSRSAVAEWNRADRVEVDELRALAENTGGRTIMGMNDPERIVPDLFQELSHYYLLGYESSNQSTDGRFRKVQVRVNRPGTDVLTRSGYFASSSDVGGRQVPSLSPGETALASGLFVEGLPLSVNLASIREAGRREVSVYATARLGPRRINTRPEETGAVTYHLVAAAFDTNWRERAHVRKAVELTLPQPGSEGQYDVHSRFELPPGRYEVRVAVQSGNEAGSVLGNIDVKDDVRDRLSASTAILGSRPAHVAVFPAELRHLPVIPTAAREFLVHDQVIAFIRFFQRPRKVLGPVSVGTTIVNESQLAVFEKRTDLEAESFNAGQGADYLFELPLKELQAGSYVLRVQAALGQDRVRREIRFTVSAARRPG